MEGKEAVSVGRWVCGAGGGACGSYWSGVRNGNLVLSKKWHRGGVPMRARVAGRERVRDHRDVFTLCCRRS